MRKEIVVFKDDIDGSEADGTTRFSVDEVFYEIDLGAENRKAFDEALAPFVKHARVTPRNQALQLLGVRAASGVSTRQTRLSPSVSERAARREEDDKIRAWARERGFEVSNRGRIAQSIRDMYANPVLAEQAAKAQAAKDRQAAQEAGVREVEQVTRRNTGTAAKAARTRSVTTRAARRVPGVRFTGGR